MDTNTSSSQRPGRGWASRRIRRSVVAVVATAGLAAAAWAVPSVASAATNARTAATNARTAANRPAGHADVPGITPTNVLIGSDQPLTGPASVRSFAPASLAFFEYVNAHGGVHGRTITYKILDDASDPATAVADENQLVNNDHVFAYFNGFGTTEHAAIVDDLTAKGVPDLFAAAGCTCWNEPAQRPGTFGYGAEYPAEGRVAGRYIARNFPGARVGYIWEDGPIGCCRQAVTQLDSEIPAAAVVSRQSFTTDVLPTERLLPQMRAAQAAGVQVLVLDTLASQAVTFALLDAASLGYHPQFMAPSGGSADPSTVGRLLTQFSGGKAGPALENGLLTEDFLPSASDTTNPWIQLFRQIHDTYEPQTPFDNPTVFGMAAAFTFTRALEAAGPDPTRASIVAAVNRGAVNFGGPGLAPLDYSPFNHAGYAGDQIGTVNNGGTVLSGPVFFTHETGPIISLPPATTRPPNRI
jgi:ABC-type branched-subunit amino acid transport system substrate-binding protein